MPLADQQEGADVVFQEVEQEKVWTVDFITYLSRILLNYDESSTRWWNEEVMPAAMALKSTGAQAALMRERFGEFAASVEFGLRERNSTPVLKSLVAKYGETAEGRRQLALAFTLLQQQPLDMIASLLQSLRPDQRLLAPFSPGLTDYLAMDPRRLLPSTQYPVWDGGVRRWVIPGIRSAAPYTGDTVEEGEEVSIFGPRAAELVIKERALSPFDYLLFSFCGAYGCAFTHALVIPIDVVKTRAQTDPDIAHEMGQGGLISGAQQIQAREGWQGLIEGWEPTILGYVWYGMTVYPGYEFFKRFLFALVGPAVVAEVRVPLVLLAGGMATVIACIGVCPAEAARIRMVSDPAFRGQGLLESVNTIMTQDGFGYFYDGLSTILVRQVLFGMMKFLVFDYCADYIFDIFPVLTEQVWTQLLVSLVSGAIAGVVSSVVSQPADTVLSRMNSEGGRTTFQSMATRVYEDEGLAGFYTGLGSRCIWAGCIISGQFFLYDVCKSLLHIKDLRVFLDVQL